MTNIDNESTKPETLSYETFIEYRKELLKIGAEQTGSFDKYLITLSTSTIGASFYLLSSMIKTPTSCTTVYLTLGWICIIASISLTLISFLVSKAAYMREIDNWDESFSNKSIVEENESSNLFTSFTKYFNYASCFLFIIGLIFVCIFTFKNIG